MYTNDDSQVMERGSPPPTYEMATSPTPYAKSPVLPKPMPQKPDEVTPSAHNVAAVRSVPSAPDARTAGQPGDENVYYSSVNKPRDDPDDVVLHENTMYGEQTFDPDNTPSHAHESTAITSNGAQPGGEDVFYSSVNKPRDDPDDVVLHENTMYAEQTLGPDHNAPQNSGNLDRDELTVHDNSMYRGYGEEVQGDDTTYYNQGQWTTAAGSTEEPDDLVIQDNLAYG